MKKSIPIRKLNKRLEAVEPPRWLWLWFPVLLLMLKIVIWSQTYHYFDWFFTEAGLIELLTPVASTLGVVTGVAVLRNRLPKWLRVWVALVTLGCFYATGEETSWLQHVFHWETPAEWAALNYYDETNLSGLDPRAEEAPKVLLNLFVLAWIIHVLFAGIIRVLFRPST